MTGIDEGLLANASLYWFEAERNSSNGIKKRMSFHIKRKIIKNFRGITLNSLLRKVINDKQDIFII